MCGLGTLSAFSSVDFMMIMSVICLFILQEFVFKCLETTRLIILTQEKARLLGQGLSAKNNCNLHELIWVQISSNVHSPSRWTRLGRTCRVVPWWNQYFHFCFSNWIFWCCPCFVLAHSWFWLAKFEQKLFWIPYREKRPTFYPA